ncbi:MAG: YceI family protein [Flavobacteriales bacterium]
MKLPSLIFAFAMFLNLHSLSAQNINEAKSLVRFEISNMKFNTVEGTFKGMTGNVDFDPSDLENAAIEVCIDATSVNTESEKRDEHLRKEDFFDTNKFPTICFNSSKFEFIDGSFYVTGILTLRGIQKEVTLPFTRNQNGFGLVGALTINRLDFSIGAETGTFMVGNEVNLEITCYLLP